MLLSACRCRSCKATGFDWITSAASFSAREACSHRRIKQIISVALLRVIHWQIILEKLFFDRLWSIIIYPTFLSFLKTCHEILHKIQFALNSISLHNFMCQWRVWRERADNWLPKNGTLIICASTTGSYRECYFVQHTQKFSLNGCLCGARSQANCLAHCYIWFSLS